jgi:toxin HigB-1
VEATLLSHVRAEKSSPVVSEQKKARITARSLRCNALQYIVMCGVTRYTIGVERFRDEATQGIRDGDDTKATRKTLPQEIHGLAARKIDRLIAAGALADIAALRGNRLEKLSGDREGQHSIRINDQYRICFVWTADGAMPIEICDYH